MDRASPLDPFHRQFIDDLPSSRVRILEVGSGPLTAIGVAHPVSVMVGCFGTEKVEQALIERLAGEHFDLRPAAIIRDLRLSFYRFARPGS